MAEIINKIMKQGEPRGRLVPKTYNISEQTAKDIHFIAGQLGLSDSAALEWIFEKAHNFLGIWLVDEKQIAKALGHKSVKKMERRIKKLR
jgi:signal recognition particle subunit SEC65